MIHYKFSKIYDFSDADLENVYKLLSDEQRLYINSLNSAKKVQSLSARALLQKVLKEIDVNASISSLCTKKSGKPYLRDFDLNISLTHSGEYVGCVVSNKPVGIDIEEIREIRTAVISRVCSSEELEYLIQNNLSDFFTLWTLKESYIKATDYKTLKVKELSFVKDGKLFKAELTGKIENYVWSIITL